jgi:hypothetical protein
VWWGERGGMGEGSESTIVYGEDYARSINETL